jgi:sulfur-oxidizing protein SoxY
MCAWSAPPPEPQRLQACPLQPGRRQALQFAGALLLLGLAPASRVLAARNEELAFAVGSLDEVLRALDATPAPDSQIALVVPESVENGAVVPVEVTSRLPGPQTIFILSEANPFPLVARFDIPAGTEPFVATRIKVAQSCNVIALVQVDGRFHSAARGTKVAVGGCGG